MTTPARVLCIERGVDGRDRARRGTTDGDAIGVDAVAQAAFGIL